MSPSLSPSTLSATRPSLPISEPISEARGTEDADWPDVGSPLSEGGEGLQPHPPLRTKERKSVGMSPEGREMVAGG